MTPPTPGTPADEEAQALQESWASDPRWEGLRRDYTAQDVVRLRGSVQIEHTLARRGATRLWDLLTTSSFVPALGALTGSQAVQMVRAGAPAIYLSGWQVAADNNLDGETYPDLGLYSVSSVPALVERINKALLRADQIESAHGMPSTDWLAPIVADAEAGFGGPLNAFTLMQHLIEAGAAAAHYEDQLSSSRKCGHLGGKVLVPTLQHVRTLRAARLAADVMGVPSLLIARTDAHAANFVSSDTDTRDQAFLTGRRTREGLFETRPGLDAAIHRGLAYAPYAEMLWFETNEPDIEEAKRFANAIHQEHPGKLLAYNCSPSFHWEEHLDAAEIAEFQPALAELGYRFQFVTLAGFHAMNAAVYGLASGYVRDGMTAYVKLQRDEKALAASGYKGFAHQKEVGAGWFDEVARVIAPGDSSAVALPGSTEHAQFAEPKAPVARPARPRPPRNDL
ncbi:MAG: isocitrate lyase [bacterium]